MGHVDPHEVPEALLPFVHGLTVARTESDDHWVSGYGNYPDVMPEEIQTEIDGKADLAGGYQADTEGPWLLIYAEPTNAAQALDLTDAARSAEYAGGPFVRVFFSRLHGQGRRASIAVGRCRTATLGGFYSSQHSRIARRAASALHVQYRSKSGGAVTAERSRAASGFRARGGRAHRR